MTTPADHTAPESHEIPGLTFAQRMAIGVVIGIGFLIGAGLWAYRGSVVFTELVDLALAACF